VRNHIIKKRRCRRDYPTRQVTQQSLIKFIHISCGFAPTAEAAAAAIQAARLLYAM